MYSWALGSIDYDGILWTEPATRVSTLNKAKLKILQIPLPPLAEQKRIAGILDAADALRAKRREALAQLDTLLQSTLLDMFGDPVANPMKWDTKSPLGEVGELITELTRLLGNGSRVLRRGLSSRVDQIPTTSMTASFVLTDG